jgi:hypothetical protein
MSYDSRQHEDCWDDLRSPATGINPPGAASDPTFDITELALSFSNAQDNVLAIVNHTPHGLDKSMPLKPHIHVYARVNPVTPKVVKWRLEYKVYERGKQVPSAWTTVNVDQTITANDYDKSATVEFGTIDISGLAGYAGFIKCKLSRIVSGQTYNSPVFLDEFDHHAVWNSNGSSAETPG